MKRAKLNYKIRMVNIGNTRNTSIDTDVIRLEEELKMYPMCEIILIGLSKGGVVGARYAMTVQDERIKKVITISSPLRGTWITKVLSKNSVIHKELGYGSELVRNMNNVEKFPVSIYHIVPRWDHLIIPTRSAAYSSTDPNNIYYYTGFYNHMGITHSVDVANAITKWLI
jgi:pimeloyl-ACP methyl ester carboxylesterase